MEIYAHRGASLEYPENTLAAFSAALLEGVTGIETDVRLTRDGELVLVHDEDLERVAGDPRRVADLTLGELRRVRLPDGEKIATLAALHDLAAKRMRLNLEVKDPRAVPPLLRFLRHHPADVLVTSEHPQAIAGVRAGLPSVPVGMVLATWGGQTLQRVQAWGCQAISLSLAAFSARVAETCSAAGVRVLLWVVNDPTVARQVEARGANGIFTDCPQTLVRALRAGAYPERGG